MRTGGGGRGGRGSEPWRRGGIGGNNSSSGQQSHSQNQQQQSQQQQPSSSRGRGGRTPSAPWSRLKPVEMDPLEAMGLPSKGDDRLLNFKTQEQYYTKIVERYMAFCSDAGQRDELLRRFASLTVAADASNNTSPSSTPSSSSAAVPPLSSSENQPPKKSGMMASRHAAEVEEKHGPNSTTSSSSLLPSTTQKATSKSLPPSNSAYASAPSSLSSSTDTSLHATSLSLVLTSLRKLREGIVASKRHDAFSIQAYLFNIRLAILSAHPESYHPALLHILRRIHPQYAMTSVEFHEVLSYLILDTACRRANLAEAYSLRSQYRFKDAKVDGVLDALAHDNYIEFNRLKGHVDGHRARLLEYAEEGMRRHSLKCFGKTYLSVEKSYLEKCSGREWRMLMEKDGVGWDLEGDKVVIKRVRAK